MTNHEIAEHIKSLVQSADKGIRGVFMGRSCLDAMTAPLHPRGPVAHDLMLAENLLRDMADAIKARREALTELREVA